MMLVTFTAAVARFRVWRIVVLALLVIGQTSTSLSAQEGQGPTRGWKILAGDRSGPDLLNAPAGVAIDRKGDVYVADSANHRIVKRSPAGDLLAAWGSAGNGPGQFVRPVGVAVDGQGFIYVADNGNARIQKLSPTGEPVA